MAKSAKTKKATKGKTGCLKPNGKLKKGWRWSKSRKGFCTPTKAAKKKGAKKVGKKAKGHKRTKRALPGLPASVTAAILSSPDAAKRYAERGAFSTEELKSFGALRRR